MFKRKKVVENHDKELQKLKSEHIRKFSCLIPKTELRNYVCSNDRLNIEINIERDNFVIITPTEIYLEGYAPTTKYIEKNIKIIMFFKNEMNNIKTKNLTETIYYIKNYNYTKIIQLLKEDKQ